MDPSQNPNIVHATTIISVRRGGHVAVAGDGQVTLGHTVMKGNARKVRRLGREGQVLAGFAGAAADAFTLFELFEAKLDKHGQLTRAAVELAKDWRTERRLGKLEALLAVADKETSLIISGTGDAVSYTHLDVYKRQVLAAPMPCRLHARCWRTPNWMPRPSPPRRSISLAISASIPIATWWSKSCESGVGNRESQQRFRLHSNDIGC